jgi:hypothetical protein
MGMVALAFLAALVIVGVLGARYGVDSRIDDAAGHHRRNL